MRMRSLVVLGIAITMMVGWSVPAAADTPWEEIEIQPGDFTECEFEPGIFTRYEVDTATLPQFDRQLSIATELPDGTVRSTFQFRRSGIQFLKLDPDAPGPDVLIEWQRFILEGVLTSGGDLLSLRATGHIVERTPEGKLVDLNHVSWEGVDANGDPIITRQTGVCNA